MIRPVLAAALARVADDLGPAEVLQFSPPPAKDPAVLAGQLWELHSRRDRFRVEVPA